MGLRIVREAGSMWWEFRRVEKNQFGYWSVNFQRFNPEDPEHPVQCSRPIVDAEGQSFHAVRRGKPMGNDLIRTVTEIVGNMPLAEREGILDLPILQ